MWTEKKKIGHGDGGQNKDGLVKESLTTLHRSNEAHTKTKRLIGKQIISWSVIQAV